MSKFLISTVETYRVDSESEVASMIETAKKDNKFILSKYQSEKKEVKAKGEVVDEYFKVQLTKIFNDIKEPDCTVDIVYNKEMGAFPTAETKEEREEETPW
jgi:hypothetical protein